MLRSRLFDFPGMGWRNPFAAMEQMKREMDALSSAVWGESGTRPLPSFVFPTVNITEDKNNYYIRAELPGIKSSDINLQVNENSISISGERKIYAEEENVKYHRREREAGRFSRAITLPGEIDGDKVDAKMTNGILTVTIAKAEAAKPKQITVN